MKKIILLLALLVLFALACSTTTKWRGALQSSPTPTASSTPSPTETPQPTATFTPSATPLPPVIGGENAAQLKKLSEFSSALIRRVAFNPDGKTFASAEGNDNDWGVNIWSSDERKLVHNLTGFSGIVWNLAYSPNGQLLASVADDSLRKHVRIWSTTDGSPLIILNGPHIADSIAFSPDGKWMAVGGLEESMQGQILVYDTATWQIEKDFNAGYQNVLALAFSPDGSQLITSGTDGRIRVWNLATGKAVILTSPGVQANQLALSPDGSLLASSFCSKTATNGCSKGGLVIWRTSDWTIVQQFADLAEGMVFSPDGSLLFSGSGANDPLVRIRRTSDWGLIRTLETPGNTVAVSPDGRNLVTSNFNVISYWGLAQ